MLSLLSAMAAPEASGAAGSTGSMMTTFVTFGLIIVIFYFLIIRPQKKRDKETKEMLAAIKKGDKVVSIGGIHGTVVAVKETTVVVKVDDNTRIEFSRNAISSIVNRKAETTEPSSKKKAKKEQVSAPEAVEAKPEVAAVEADAEKKDNN
ncbi:MAG: preprotein translocase subunit YajC [Sphaerochaeta sp.]|jgi:preprotein translocase subunit YajC|uniref:Sec translocon accessory complex subunit YajC n=3 Tax=root TaxID=1 RepID=A0ABY4D9K7_9SPIR|nr:MULTISPECIES: preprotein translocase subunit YajC [Sphaerochaeta]MDT3358558.1 preprotein translocase subunit YajC [Spirochaetota bacterium]NLA97723.1 preprotein translocase subunit YajC [Spirochaetales bacterium]MDD3423509.1 preprotein translocase subunit YajC [Sphaerochaeta sp.]MDD3455771.1 preprotein translocase subunit YajC [Sphaerochaeta sp.]MDD4037795.1 preprotein translocase subunit YajC [Sphaerochaeta sp.]